MRLSLIFLRASLLCVCPAILVTIGLYLYPAILGCSFPLPSTPLRQEKPVAYGTKIPHRRSNPGSQAPFRLLALGDPQIEGDSSLPSQHALSFPSLRHLKHVPQASHKIQLLADIISELFTRDLPIWLRFYHKRLDLLGNDYYLAHIYRTLRWWAQPTHVAVLGDLIGSQWVSDAEFQRRSWRYWNRVFRHGRKVDAKTMENSRTEVLGEDQTWVDRVINVAGNHDIGYAGDITRERLDRFEREYGRVNWDIEFQMPLLDTGSTSLNGSFINPSPSLRLVVLNNMNLDGPALDLEAQAETYQYINSLISTRLRPVEDRTFAVILLTHIPLEKQSGVCVDSPYFSYRDTGIKEQNHLSSQASRNILEGIYGKSNQSGAPAKGFGRNGIIVAGHDHEGCDVYHYTSAPPNMLELETARAATKEDARGWRSKPWHNAKAIAASNDIPGVREITLRSMMGSYGGYAGLLSAWFDEELKEWRFEHIYCPLGVQHIWWAVHILDLMLALSILGSTIFYAAEQSASGSQVPRQKSYAGATRSSIIVTNNVSDQPSTSTGSQVAIASSQPTLRKKKLGLGET